MHEIINAGFAHDTNKTILQSRLNQTETQARLTMLIQTQHSQ